jgi:hypothetical protein
MFVREKVKAKFKTANTHHCTHLTPITVQLNTHPSTPNTHPSPPEGRELDYLFSINVSSV